MKKVKELKIEDGFLNITYDNGDFICAAINEEKLAPLLETWINCITVTDEEMEASWQH